MKLLLTLLAGLLFGVGLAIAGMTDPAKVIGFLDVTGQWQPTLGFVMGAALIITGPAFAIMRRRQRPLLAASFDFPTKTRVDRPLVMGAALFGIGWGLAGYCPGPAVASLLTGGLPLVYFFVAMVVGIGVTNHVNAQIAHREAS